MRPVVDFITLVVSDLRRSIAFYTTAFQWPTEGIQPGHEDHCLFELENQQQILLFSKEAFQNVTGRTVQNTQSGVILSHVCTSPEEMHNTLRIVFANGAKPAGEIKEYPWGVSVHFMDPDDHLWELVYLHLSTIE